MGETFKGYWSDENFREVFRKFKWQCSKMRNTNQNTLIRHFYDFAQDRKRQNSFFIPVQSTAIARRNKTKYFVLRWFDEVCSEFNDVNEEAESKKSVRECETVEILPSDFRDSRETPKRVLRDCTKLE